MEAALDRFRAANTQVLGVSVDSVHCHANWARDLGGVSFPLLADFAPKGALARSVGHYLEDAGITDRASVLIDKDGVIRYSVSVTPSGKRDIDELVAECEKLGAGDASSIAAGESLSAGTTLFVKSQCGPSRLASCAVANLGLGDSVAVKNVSEDAGHASELAELGGKGQAPCLVMDGNALFESSEIVRALADRVAPLA